MADQLAAVECLTLAVRLKKPVLLWGAPGTGKTSVVQQLAEVLGLRIETVIASLREPSDFAGLPIVNAGGSVSLAAPTWATRLVDAGAGILFLDEITTAPPSVQAALLRVVLERVVGDVDLPVGIAVVAAANPPDLAAGGWDLAAPLANRFCHIDWPIDAARYIESLSAGWTMDALAASDPTGSNDAGPRVRGALAGFLRSRPALLHAMPNDAANAGRAWPSPRTWDMACELWIAAEELCVSEEARLLAISGCVGPGPARELLVWATDADLPDPEVILADASQFRLPDRGDRQFAVLSAVTAAVIGNNTKERWIAGFSVIEQAVERGAADVAAVAARTLAEHAPADLGALPPSVTALAPVLGRAGMLRRPSS